MSVPAPLDPDRLPRHVAIVMDGNGRWARNRRKPRRIPKFIPIPIATAEKFVSKAGELEMSRNMIQHRQQH